MQPTYLPWVGFFDMLDQADLFVLLDTVPINRKSWQTRNRIRRQDGELAWLSIPNNAKQGDRLDHVTIDHGSRWQERHWNQIEAAYGKATHYDWLASVLSLAYRDYSFDRLTVFTSCVLRTVAGALGITTPIIHSSMLNPQPPDRVERLASICQQVGATSLLDTPGAEFLHAYPEITKGVPIEWHGYQPVPYSQDGQPWQPHLAIIDLLAWHGRDATAIIQAGRT